MPEAVIVDTVRTPIGRAFKGSLIGHRPDDMAAFILDALLDRVPEVKPEDVEEVAMGCGLPQGEQAWNIGRIAVLLVPPSGHHQRHHDRALLLLEPGRDQLLRQPDQGRAGRHLHRRRRRGRLPLQRAAGGRGRRAPQPEARRPGGPRRRLHRHGDHGGERGEQVRREARGHGPVRAALPGAGRGLAGERLLRQGDRADPGPGRDRGQQGRRPARELDVREARPSWTRRSAAAA